MHDKAIRRLDRAALELIQALDTYGEELKPYLGVESLETLRAETVMLRRVMLGLTMGILYQDWEAPPIPADEVAAQMVDLLKQRPQGDEEEK